MNGANIIKDRNMRPGIGVDSQSLTKQERSQLAKSIIGRGNLKATAEGCKTDPLTIKHAIHGGFNHLPETVANIRAFLGNKYLSTNYGVKKQ